MPRSRPKKSSLPKDLDAAMKKLAKKYFQDLKSSQGKHVPASSSPQPVKHSRDSSSASSGAKVFYFCERNYAVYVHTGV